MKHPYRCNIVSSLMLAALVISGAAFYSACVNDRNKSAKTDNESLVIRNTNSGWLYGKWPLEEPKEFAIEFIHSVNQSPVREFFKIEGNMIRLVAVRFFSFGAGMLSDLEEGQTLSQDGDALIISGFKTSFKELNYIIGTVSDHLLIIKDEHLSLRELCGKNAHITISFE